MYTPRTTSFEPAGNAAIFDFAPHQRRSPSRSPHKPHVYRNLFIGAWICDQEGTRATPGPDSARTVYRTHAEAVRAAIGVGAAR